MNKIQKISFKSIDEFLDYIPDEELKIVDELRNLVFDCIPDINEKLSYNVPFYARKKTICFIWPASIPWGNVKENHVVLGFSNGHQIPDPFNILERETRRHISTISFSVSEGINPEVVRFYLFEALELDK